MQAHEPVYARGLRAPNIRTVNHSVHLLIIEDEPPSVSAKLDPIVEGSLGRRAKLDQALSGGQLSAKMFGLGYLAPDERSGKLSHGSSTCLFACHAFISSDVTSLFPNGNSCQISESPDILSSFRIPRMTQDPVDKFVAYEARYSELTYFLHISHRPEIHSGEIYYARDFASPARSTFLRLFIVIIDFRLSAT
jgi:hypothetical protein